ncbi:MAG: hypothetical protein ONA69_02340, partial [candidate division KSB1 bacterium]|nr:hypothetical protein [candidate division KSB1 bacterium]
GEGERVCGPLRRAVARPGVLSALPAAGRVGCRRAGGRRNVTGGDEQFLVFNIQNPTALRDNLRQSALELILLARSLAELRIDASACEGLNEPAARFDVSRVALMGHSMGGYGSWSIAANNLSSKFTFRPVNSAECRMLL